jgi:hypothetical protein
VIDTVLRVAFVVVAVAAGLMGVAMLAYPADTGDYFAWQLGPVPLASLVGGLFVASTLVFGLAIRRSWVEVRGVVAAVLGLTVPMLAATIVHEDVFTFSRPVAVVWVVLFVASPLTYGAVLVLRRDEAADADAPGLPDTVRAGFAALATAFVGFAVLCWIGRLSVAEVVPFDLTPMGAAFLGAWSLFVAVLALWPAVRPTEELELPLIALVAYPLAGVVSALLTWDEFTGGQLIWVLALLGVAVAALAQLRPKLPVTRRLSDYTGSRT